MTDPLDRARKAARAMKQPGISTGCTCARCVDRFTAALLRFAAGDVEAEAREAGARFEHMDVVSYVKSRRALAEKVEGGRGL